MHQSSILSNENISPAYCSCEHCLGLHDGSPTHKLCVSCNLLYPIQSYEKLPNGSLRNVCRDCKRGIDRNRSRVFHQHQREACPKCGSPKMVESKLCRNCYKANTQAEHRECSTCKLEKSISQFPKENIEVCLRCQKKIDRAKNKSIKAAARAAASICSCGKTKLPESQRCRTCGAALAGAAKLAKLAVAREGQMYTNHPPIELPSGKRGPRLRPMRNLGDLRLTPGYRLYCILCASEEWIEKDKMNASNIARVRCECGGTYLAEPESRRLWK